MLVGVCAFVGGLRDLGFGKLALSRPTHQRITQTVVLDPIIL
jgi:hypothetical protein